MTEAKKGQADKTYGDQWVLPHVRFWNEPAGLIPRQCLCGAPPAEALACLGSERALTDLRAVL
jgi:hypothetical protein